MAKSTIHADVEAEEKRGHDERVESRALKAKLASVEKDRDRLAAQLNLIESIDDSNVRIPHWVAPPKKKSSHHRATLCLLFTDPHFDEEVNPDEVEGLNAYSREIAETRVRYCFERFTVLCRQYLAGVEYDGVCLLMGGDNFSGNIHEELARTNADTLFASLLHWLDPVLAGIGMLADEFGRVHVASVAGNHGRMTRQPIAKRRAADNIDWLFYKLLIRHTAKDNRITWTVPDGADARLSVYNTKILLTHGDQFRGGSGISSAMAPLLLGAHRKTRRAVAAGTPYDVMACGHWHQTLPLFSRGVVVGGSLKGYDEYAYCSNFDYEPAQQQAWVVTPERGVTFNFSVHVCNRKAEGW